METDLVQVNMPKDILRGLRWLADRQGITPTEALKKAISNETYLLEELENKKTITIKVKRK